MNKRLWIVLAVLIVAAVGGMFWANSNSKKEAEQKTSYIDQLDGSKLVTVDAVADAMAKDNGGQAISQEERDKIIPDHYQGNKDAKVTVLMYEDFACTHCQAFNSYAEKIIDDYGDRVLFIMRDFSLNYPNSTATLTAGESVAKLGGNDAFWKMSRELFKDETWVGSAVDTSKRKDLFNQYAKAAGIEDTDQLNDTINASTNNGVKDKIERDKKLGEKAGVTGTPTWIVNGEKAEETTDSAIRQAIDKALEKVGK